MWRFVACKYLLHCTVCTKMKGNRRCQEEAWSLREMLGGLIALFIDENIDHMLVAPTPLTTTTTKPWHPHCLF